MKKRVFGLAILIIVAYILGYFNKELSIIFLNQRSAFAFVFTCCILIGAYNVYLHNKILRIRLSHEYDYEKLRAAEYRERNYKSAKDQFKELKEILVSNDSRVSELKNSISLCDGIIKDLNTRIDALTINIELKEIKINDLEKKH